MTAENTSATGAESTQQDAQDADPFSSFESEAFEKGERVEDIHTPVQSADEGSADEPDEGSGDGGEEKGDDEKSKSKPKQSFQDRIDDLTGKWREEERQRTALEERLREIEALSPEPPKKDGSPKDEPKPEDAEPNPDDFQYGELDPRYIRALTAYESKRQFESLVAEQRQRDAEAASLRAQQEARQKFDQRTAEAVEKYPDYQDKVIVGAERNKWALSPDLADLLVQSDVGTDIAYHLASHPEEALEVYRQSPLEQARYFGRMEAKFSAAQDAAHSDSAEKPAPPKTPKAPTPVTPARGSDGKFSPSADTDDFAAFEKLANNQ